MKKKFTVNKTIELKIDDTTKKNIEQLMNDDIKDMFVISSDEWNKARIEESRNNEQ